MSSPISARIRNGTLSAWQITEAIKEKVQKNYEIGTGWSQNSYSTNSQIVDLFEENLYKICNRTLTIDEINSSIWFRVQKRVNEIDKKPWKATEWNQSENIGA